MTLAGPVGAAESQGATIQWATDSDIKDNWDQIRPKLYDAGLPNNIDINVLALPSQTGNRRSQFQQWLGASRAKPDLLHMDTGWTVPFIVREEILNLSQNLPNDVVQTVNDDYFQASVNAAKDPQSGDLYGVPLYPDFPTMLYRKDLVEQAGYDPEGEGWARNSITWQKFSNVVRDVMDNNDIQYGFTFQADVYEGLSCCDFNEFMSSFGGAYFGGRQNLFGPIGERPVTVNEQPVIDSIRMVRTFLRGQQDEFSLDGYAGPISPRAVLQWIEDPSLNPFSNGDAVAHRNWPYAIRTTGTQDVFGQDLGVMPIPYGVSPQDAKYKGTGGPVASLGGWNTTVNPNTNNQQAALQVVQALMDQDVKLTLFETIGWLPPEPQLLDTQRARNIDIMGRYLEQLKIAGQNAVPRPVTAVWPQESDKIAQQVNNTYAGQAPPQQAMNQLKQQLEAIETSV